VKTKTRRFIFQVNDNQGWPYCELRIRAKDFKAAVNRFLRFEKWVSESQKMHKSGIHITLRESFDANHVVPPVESWVSVVIFEEVSCPQCKELYTVKMFSKPRLQECRDCRKLLRLCFYRKCSECDMRIECLASE